jgi:hypothetical protein
MPDVPSKVHIVRLEPVIELAHSDLVHHMTVHECENPLSAADLDFQGDCQRTLTYEWGAEDSTNRCRACVRRYDPGSVSVHQPKAVWSVDCGRWSV